MVKDGESDMRIIPLLLPMLASANRILVDQVNKNSIL